MKIKVIIIFSLFILPVNALGTVEYAQQTGKSCQVCHIDPTGGGKLTEEGKKFKNDLQIRGLHKPLTTLQRIIRFLIGYIHTMTAIIWFGAILYVHLLLKPAYAARGLPKGELRLGWISIIVIAVTGTLLAFARVPSWHMLLNTRFGILLLTKISLFFIMVLTAATVTFIIGPRMKRKKQFNVQRKKQDLTVEEVAQFDGKEGRPVFVAYNGKIYDLSKSTLWKEGTHMVKHQAGSDLTDEIKNAPHKEDKVIAMPLVGKLITSEKKGKLPHEKVFYFFAYMNLILIFLIVFVISLWRWW